MAECPQCGSPPTPGRLTCRECGASAPGWDLAASVYATGGRTEAGAEAERKEVADATAGARRPALAFHKRSNSPRALLVAPPAELPPGGPTFAGDNPVASPVAPPKGDPAQELPPGVRAPLWTPADTAPPPTRPDAVIPWGKLCAFLILVVVATGGYKAYPRVHAWYVARFVPADLRPYVRGRGLEYAAAGQGYSVRLPKAPVHGDTPLGAQPAPWNAIHRTVVAGSDYRIVIRVADLASSGPLPFGLAGALADQRLGGTPAPHDVQLHGFDDKPAYSFHVDGPRPTAGRIFRRGSRVYVVSVESNGAGHVLDAVLRSFTIDGE